MSRQRWSSRTTFLLAAIGSAVGLGNVWRFPYLAGTYGGGAFLLPYAIAVIVIGVPLLVLEFAIGQQWQCGAIAAYRCLHPWFGGLGLYALLSSFAIVTYYAVVMGWTVLYLLASPGVPWSEDTETYFFQDVLDLSSGIGAPGGIVSPVLAATVLVWVAVYFCVWRGTSSVGAIVQYTVPLPVLLLGVLLLRAATLDGSGQGLQLYLTPQWSAIADPQVWSAACSQVFFSLTLGFGVTIAYASYKNPDDDIVKDTWITAIANSAISLLAGLTVFGVLGYLAAQTETPVAELAASGPGLAFVVFPTALSLMPAPGFFSACFFAMLLTLGIDSAFSLVEAINATLLDTRLRLPLSVLSLLICGAALAIGTLFTTQAGLFFLDLFDHFITNYNLIAVGLIEVLLAGWVYGAERLRHSINAVSDWPLGRWWTIAIRYVIPTSLSALLVAQLHRDLSAPYEDYPAWALGLGWTAAIAPLLVLVGTAIAARRASQRDDLSP